MSKIADIASRAARFFRGRVGARMLLILGCVVCLSIFTPYVDKVSIADGDEVRTFYTLRENPQEVLSQYGLAPDGADSYRVVDGENEKKIEILHAFDVTVVEAGVEYTVEVSDGTVADAIAAAGIQLPDGDDYVSPALGESVYPYMTITLDRVEYEESVRSESIAYRTVKHETSELFKGETKVAVAGKDGEKKVTVRKRYVNGVFADEVVIDETVISEAVNEVIDVGTASRPTSAPTAAAGNNSGKNGKNGSSNTPANAPSSSLSTKPAGSSNATGGTFTDSNGRSVAYSKILTGVGTAYTGESGALTSTGREVELGVVAVDPSVIPYGTRLYIASADGKHVYGYALAADTGSALKSGDVLVDVFYPTDSQCNAFGKCDVIVYVLS